MISRKIVLRFAAPLVDQPIIYHLVKDYDLSFNILKASISPQEEGVLVFELTGEKKHYDAGIQYLKGLGVQIQPFSEDVRRDEQKCTHCGVCVVLCPTAALSVDRTTLQVLFDSGQCIACGACIRACPPRAMEMYF